MADAARSDSSSEVSSVSSDQNGEVEVKVESMTGKGIKHPCSELIEIKAESDEDFYRNIFSNYSAFNRVFNEVQGMKNKLMLLRTQLSTQNKLVNDLLDGIMHPKVMSEETIESIILESEATDEPTSPSRWESHIDNLSETLDILLLEDRIDEAISIFEMEDENFQRMQCDEKSSADLLMLYSSALSEKKDRLISHLTLAAENPRICAAELQKALVGICRLGDIHCATQLSLKYYHLRIAKGIQKLQCSKSFSHGIYVKELAKFVFSMISQAAGGFVILYGATSPRASELINWTREETKIFVASFDKYVKSISEISGGLSTAVEALQFALSYCSLLETQKLLLKPCLFKHIRPHMEQILRIHIEHFEKVIGIFTASDTWVLGRYLVPGILYGGNSSMDTRQQPDYCLLTNSGRKFLTFLQAIK
ncbi:hypothetical protein SLE2022_208870 [Rubroshorea leprosula]